MPSSTDDAGRAGAGDRDAAPPAEETPTLTTPASEAPGYETRDANTRGVLGFLAVLFVVVNLVLFVTWRLFRYYEVAERSPVPASSFADQRQLPPAPDLAVNGPEDFQKMYAEQQQKLDSYAWEDRQAGVVRVPIERAMDLLLEKGLPVMPSAAQGQSAAGTFAPKSRASGSSASSAVYRDSPRRDDQ
jgi:hypothetical protein